MAGKQKRRKKDRGWTVVPAHAGLEEHIAGLGLGTAQEYREWCRQHGFSDRLEKNTRQRRLERKAAQEDEATAAVEEELRQHIGALGLESVEEYRAWCTEQGLSDALYKGGKQRRKERERVGQVRGDADLAALRRHTRRPQHAIVQISEGVLEEEGLRTDYLRKIHEMFAGLEGDEKSRKALKRLLLQVERHAADLFDMGPAIERFGGRAGNTFIEGLAALARHWGDWFQPVETWQPKSHNRRRQFNALARHLLAQYEVPAFMDSVWFKGEAEAERQQEWFKHVGRGQNIRTADLPLRLSKKMAHYFLQAPAQYTVEEALRWGQVIGQGGSERLAQAVLATQLGTSFERETFWGTAVQFLINNPMLDPACVGPIVDFIQHQKYEPQQVAGPGGRAERGAPLQPNFLMKGRSALKLLGQVEAWHAELAKETQLPPGQWKRSGIGEFSCDERDESTGESLSWSIRELLSTRELLVEGRQLHHCVSSYAKNCQKEKTSIWSLQVANARGREQRLMTIALDPQNRVITQARGKYNAAVRGSFQRNIKQRGLEAAYHTYLRRSQNILQQWMEQEELSMVHYI